MKEEDFEIVKEDWNEYKLLDGGSVRVKTTIARIFRVLDERGNPAVTDDGDPSVVVRHNVQIISTD
ncbi:MAG TPA: hypothetical protein VIP09_14355 [Dehalococcoidia bacterium]